MIASRCACFLSVCVATALAGDASAASFRFDTPASPLNGQAAGVLVADGVAMNASALPSGGWFDVRSAGLGINSRPIAGATDGEIDKFNLLGGSAAGQPEAIAFSFDHAGVINALYFDGVKDESFEFFRLEGPGGLLLSIFDGQIGLRLTDVATVAEPNVTLLDEAPGTPVDDDLFGLSIPFQAGDVFTLTYGEYAPDPATFVPGFSPLAPNGARFQGLDITPAPVPEPASVLTAAATLALAAGVARKRT
ncbi:hypothetical protein Pla175_47490 [Pirellulimonas nuda]|uniref:PEP-CTERM protein-sorting domain-containing protein n=1 Tax=Pirellulimonas nuda TaxID=2528009 RepID=A0A518DIM9_9BACT|nr:hypothetical protein [Pirellulimonas nuda]QDU91328.1 hypothetical protein Pla175_47490 [Pirellulimonas nuda]